MILDTFLKVHFVVAEPLKPAQDIFHHETHLPIFEYNMKYFGIQIFSEWPSFWVYLKYLPIQSHGMTISLSIAKQHDRQS